MIRLIYAIVLAIILSFVIGCKSKTIYVPVETETTKTEYKDRFLKDSIYIHDSIFMKMQNDTVWLEKYRTLYKERLVRDSIFITDSIRIEVPYPVVETKEVNRLKNWQMILMLLGVVPIILAGYKIYRVIK